MTRSQSALRVIEFAVRTFFCDAMQWAPRTSTPQTALSALRVTCHTVTHTYTHTRQSLSHTHSHTTVTESLTLRHTHSHTHSPRHTTQETQRGQKKRDFCTTHPPARTRVRSRRVAVGPRHTRLQTTLTRYYCTTVRTKVRGRYAFPFFPTFALALPRSPQAAASCRGRRGRGRRCG